MHGMHRHTHTHTHADTFEHYTKLRGRKMCAHIDKCFGWLPAAVWGKTGDKELTSSFASWRMCACVRVSALYMCAKFTSILWENCCIHTEWSSNWIHSNVYRVFQSFAGVDSVLLLHFMATIPKQQATRWINLDNFAYKLNTLYLNYASAEFPVESSLPEHSLELSIEFEPPCAVYTL